MTQYQSAAPQGHLIVKGGHLLDAIIMEEDLRKSVPIYTWDCSRMIRRDFNRLSAKMWHQCHMQEKRTNIRSMLFQLNEGAFWLSLLVQPEARGNKVHSVFEARFVSVESQTLMDAFLTVDRVLSVLGKPIGNSHFDRRIAKFFRYYGRLKNYVFHDEEFPSLKIKDSM